MRKTFPLLAALAVGRLFATPAEDRLWATRVKCELNTATDVSLPDLTWQQGTTPRLSLDQYRQGKSVDADTNVTAIVRFGPSATGAYFVASTNYAVSGNGYLVDIPTVGTNTTGVTAGWWYTAYFEKSGRRFWTGNGRLDIVATSSNEDALNWQAIASGSELVQAEALLRIAGDAANSNHVAAVRTELLATNAAARAALALHAAGHAVTDDGGFAGGTWATATTGGAVGENAMTLSGGAVGYTAYTDTGGAVGEGASAAGGGAVGYLAHTDTGGAVGVGASATTGFGGGQGAAAMEGGAVGEAAWAASGGAVGYMAYAYTGAAVGDGAKTGNGFAGGAGAQTVSGEDAIDAIQLGTGVNPDAGTLQVYLYKLLDADGTIPVERIPAAITNGLLSQAGAAATYLPLANIPGPGCTDLGTGMTVALTGATTAYTASPTGTVTLAVSESAPRYSYALELYGTNAVTMGTGLTLFGSWTPTWTNIVAIVPSTGTLWRVYGRGL